MLVKRGTQRPASEVNATPTPAATSAALDAAAVAAVRAGDSSQFEALVQKYSPKLFGLIRKYAQREDDVADLVQDVFLRAYRRLHSWRGDAPFEHWLTRLAINCSYDYLRTQSRRREEPLADLTEDESEWLERHGDKHRHGDESDRNSAEAARSLVARILRQLSPANRVVIELLEIEDRSVREVSQLTGWSIPVVKVRAFRARAEMRRILGQIDAQKYL